MGAYFNPEDYGRLKKEYQNKIRFLKEWLWGNDVSFNDVEKWIKNFQGYYKSDKDREQLIALHLLSQFMFFSQKEIRIMLISMYRDLYMKPLLQTLRKNSPSMTVKEAENMLLEKMKVTRFLGIGNSSESSCLLLYYFRQVNKLPNSYFMDNCNIYFYDNDGRISGLQKNEEGNEIDYYVFIDDLAGTGKQAEKFFKNIRYEKILEYNKNAKILYFTLFRTDKAKQLFEEELPNIIFNSIFELDDTYKCFGEESRHFVKKENDPSAHEQEKKYAKGMCETYMKNKVEKYEICGFLDSQLMLAFFYNTPNNTLPIFWAENDCKWTPLFRRYAKEIRKSL